MIQNTVGEFLPSAIPLYDRAWQGDMTMPAHGYASAQ